MALLAFETSCDETSVALVRDGEVLSNIVASQIKLHAEYGGVVPELAAREHLRNVIPVARTALAEAGVDAAGIGAVAATQGPGLPTALLVGFRAAQGLAFCLNCPFVGINHHEAHLYSPWLLRSGSSIRAKFEDFQPNVSLIVSGGHTMLVHVRACLEHEVLGSTVDDAAGECFDKTGKLLGLPYPAGPIIESLAQAGNPSAFDLPKPMLRELHDDFSFSGLKTSVRYLLRDHPEISQNPQQLRDLCASVQDSITEVLVEKTVRAALRMKVRCVTASGGVTCNQALRQRLRVRCSDNGLALRLADPSLCTDNAAMIAVLAEQKLQRQPAGIEPDSEISPAMQLS